MKTPQQIAEEIVNQFSFWGPSADAFPTARASCAHLIQAALEAERAELEQFKKYRDDDLRLYNSQAAELQEQLTKAQSQVVAGDMAFEQVQYERNEYLERAECAENELTELKATIRSRKNPGCDATCLNYCLHDDKEWADELRSERDALKAHLEEAQANNEELAKTLKEDRHDTDELIAALQAENVGMRGVLWDIQTNYDCDGGGHIGKDPQCRACKAEEALSASPLTKGLMERLKTMDRLLLRAHQYLKEGKAKFAPNTTNSFVDELLDDIAAYKAERERG